MPTAITVPPPTATPNPTPTLVPTPTPIPTALPTATPRPEPTVTPTPEPKIEPTPYSGGLLLITPACATPGTTLTVEASGLSPDSDYDITMDGVVLITAHTDNEGSILTTMYIPPRTLGGFKAIFAYGSKGKEAATTIGVTPTLSLASSTGAPGFRLFLAGNGYQANETVPIKFGDAIAGTASSDEFGDWSGDIMIPPVPAGTYPVSVPGPCGPVQLSFRVTA